MIVSRTPFRVSFFGGGTDYPAWFREHGGAVLATAIDKYCYISVRYLPPFFKHKSRIVYSKVELINDVSDIQHPAVRGVLSTMGVTDGLEIHHDGDLPARSGLGSSSSFTVGLVNAIKGLRGEMISSEELARQAIYIEQEVLKENVGSQDQVTTACGGFNKIFFSSNGTFSLQPILLGPEKVQALENHLMLFFTGFERFASDVAKSKIANLPKKKKELFTMHEMVDEALNILSRNPFVVEDFGKLLHESWLIKRTLSDQVSTPEIDSIYEAARSAGAIGGKILGAGSGGFLLLFVPPEAQERVRQKLGHLICVPFRFDPMGSRIVLYQPNGFR
ncbi:MAG: kinase [Elusimicrobia bacterium]|nr:kinase [Elusimicrobiota bacterium]